MVQTVRYPAVEANFDRVRVRSAGELAARNGAIVKVATVSLASADEPSNPLGSAVQPIFRGAGLIPRFTGLADLVIAMDGYPRASLRGKRTPGRQTRRFSSRRSRLGVHGPV